MLSGLSEQCPVVGETFKTASDVLGFDLWNVCQHGPVERLNQTDVTQPDMLAAGIATWRAWKSLGGFYPDYFAGHSLGEYSALVRQLSQPVRWAASIQTLIGEGVTRFAECGPGRVLAGLNRRISRDISSDASITRENLAETLANWS